MDLISDLRFCVVQCAVYAFCVVCAAKGMPKKKLVFCLHPLVFSLRAVLSLVFAKKQKDALVCVCPLHPDKNIPILLENVKYLKPSLSASFVVVAGE